MYRGGTVVTALEWLRSEIEAELGREGPPNVGEAPEFDAALEAALSDLGLSDRAIDLLCEVASAVETNPAAAPAPLVSDPGIQTRRMALGLSTSQAADMVGVSTAGYEAIERAPLRWQNVNDVGRIAAFLARLRIPTATFVRWLASLRPAEPGHAWGYRPGAVVDGPVESTSGDQAQFLHWGSQLLREETPRGGSSDAQLLGEVWSPAVVADRAAAILHAARARLLATELRTEAPESSAGDVIIFNTDDGPVYPAFQFDSTGAVIPIVAEINALLGANDDPWGVADWWLGDEPSLGSRPADLVAGSIADHERLRVAARELIEGE